MPDFAYQALDAGGNMREGALTARTRAEALQLLTARRLQPVRLRAENSAAPAPSSSAPPASGTPAKSASPAGRTKSTTSAAPRRIGLNSAQQLLFTTEMVELLQAGLQLEQALGVMETREERSSLKAIAGAVRTRVREGSSFSKALHDVGSGFSPLFISVCSAGEAAGALGKMLESQAEHMAFLQDLQKRLVSAMIYPCIVLLAGVGLLVLFMTFLLPQLTGLLGKTGAQLPLVTRLLIGASEWFAVWWWTIPVVVGLLIFAQRLWVRSPSGKRSWDALVLGLPLFGALLRKRFLAQFLQTLATLAANGVNLLQSLNLVRGTFSNTLITEALQQVSAEVSEGVPLSRSLKKQPLFPPALIDILRIGEQTGDMPAALRRGAEKYDREFNLIMQRFSTLIQPLSILVVAVFVGVVAYAMISGILSSVSGLRLR
jgi:type II secretory pathway component PulF